MKQLSLSVLTIMLLISAFQACKKSDSISEETQELSTSQDIAIQNDLDEAAEVEADLAIEERGGGNDCPIVTFLNPEGTWPNTITIDFGDSCERLGRATKKGKIIIQQSAPMSEAGAERTMSFENFFIDAVGVSGSRHIVNNGPDATTGLYSFSKTAQNMTFTYSDGTTTTWSGTHVVTLTEGYATLTFIDNVWSITGSKTGTNRYGNDFTATITTPLIKRGDCRWIVSGEIQFNFENRQRTLNFGDGNCDQTGTLTRADGTTRTVLLRRF